MGILFGRETRSWIPEPPVPANYTLPASQAPVTPERAMQVPTVWACVGLLANAVSMLPLETFRRSPDGVPARAKDPQIVTSPSAGMTQSEWLHMLMVSLLLRGNAYGRITARDAMLRPTQIELLNPDKVIVTIDPLSGAISYKLKMGGTVTPLPTEDVWHVRGLTLPGTKVGLSPIAYAAATIGVDLGSRKFASDFFDGGGIPKAVLKTTQVLSADQAGVAKTRLLSSLRNREPLVLGAGLDYQAISVKPEESQFLATQMADVAQIARYYWIPPEMVGGSGGNSLTYANVEQRQLDFYTLSVSWWLKRLEDAIFALLPQPQYVRFDTSALLRTDAKTQAEVDNMRLAGRVRAPSEIRARDGLPPMTEEQKIEADLVPLTITPNGGVKALPAIRTPPGPEAPVPADDTQPGGSDAAVSN